MKSRWLFWMILFVAVFYSFVLLAHFFGRDSAQEQKDLDQKQKASQLFKQKEEIARQKLKEHPVALGAVSLTFSFLFFWGICLDIDLLIRKFRGTPWPLASLPFPEVRWGFRDVLTAFLFLLFAEGFLFLVQSSIILFMGIEGRISDSVLILTSFIRNLMVAAFVIWIVRTKYGQGLAELGFRGNSFWRHVKDGIFSYIAVIPPLLLCFFVLSYLLQIFSVEPEPQQVVQLYLKDSAQPYLVGLTLFVAVLGPVMEELFFRGVAYAGFRKKFGVWPAAVLCSLMFATLHMHWIAFFPIFFLGMFLTMLYEISGSLIPSITAHVLHNTLMVGVMLGFRSLSGY